MTIAERVSKARAAKGYTRRLLAKLAEVNEATIVNIEMGKTKNPGVETLGRIADALDVPDCWLAYGKWRTKKDTINL